MRRISLVLSRKLGCSRVGPTTPFGEVEQAALQHLVGGGTDAGTGDEPD